MNISEADFNANFSGSAKALLLVVFFLLFSAYASAQTDSTATKKDVVKQAPKDTVKEDAPKIKPKKQRIYKPDSTHLPSKAVFRSAVIPGWGQLYNKRWWKVPFIYGGLTGLGLSINFNQFYYKKYLALAVRKQNMEVIEAPYTNTTLEAFTSAKTFYKRNRDLSTIGIGALWAIQVVEAYIDAKFIHSYSMDDNLAFKLSPKIIPQPVYAFTPGMAFTPGLSLIISIR